MKLALVKPSEIIIGAENFYGVTYQPYFI